MLPFEGQISPLRCASVEMTKGSYDASVVILLRKPDFSTSLRYAQDDRGGLLRFRRRLRVEGLGLLLVFVDSRSGGVAFPLVFLLFAFSDFCLPQLFCLRLDGLRLLLVFAYSCFAELSFCFVVLPVAFLGLGLPRLFCFDSLG